MRNWHKRLIQIPQNVTGNNVVIGVIDVGLLEFARKNTSNVDPVLSPPNYKVAHPSFDDNSGAQESRVFFRKNDEDQHLSTEKININNVINSNHVKAHIINASGIIVGKLIENNFIEGIAPNASLINSQEVIDVFILTNTHIYALKNSDPNTALYYNDKLVRKNLMISTQVPSGNLTPENMYSKKSASIINLSISWKDSGEDTPTKIGNPNQNECQFILNEIFAYARNGRGAIIISSAGNGENINGTQTGIELKKENYFIRASDKAFMVSASSIDTTGFDNNTNSYDNLNNLSEIHAQYSNYGEKTVDICAPSTPIGILDEKSLGIYSPTKKHCGEAGFENQYVEINVLSKDIQNRKLKLESTNGIFPGQSVDIGNVTSFANEIRYIEEVDRLSNNITLDRNFFFTKNTQISSIKILQLKRNGKRNKSPNEINKLNLDFDEMLSRGLKTNQEVFIYPQSDVNKGIYTTIISKSYPSLEVKNSLANFSLEETLVIIPGKMTAKLERTGGGNAAGRYKFMGSDDIKGFFNGQLIKIIDGEKKYIYDLTEVDYSTRAAEITLYRLPPNGSTITIESLSYGQYTSKFGGTSAATPIISGVAALVLSTNSQLNAAEIKHILKISADKITGQNNYDLQNNPNEYDYGYSKNKYFGTGRVNAEEAVKLALRWHIDNSVEKPKMHFPKSPNVPDIWVSEKTNVIANSTNLYNTLNTSQDQNIFIRVKNIGNRYSFQETDLRVLIAFTNEPDPKFPFPNCWHQNAESSTMKTVLLDVQEIIPIAPGSDAILKIEWRKLSALYDIYNKKGVLKTYILAHIAPFDGVDTDLSLLDATFNKNLLAREIIATHTSNNTKGNSGEKVSISHESNKFNLLAKEEITNGKFSFDNINIPVILLNTMEFNFSLTNRKTGNIEQTIVFKKNGNSWEMDKTPTKNWLSANMDIQNSELYGANYKKAFLNYELNYNNADKEIKLKVIQA